MLEANCDECGVTDNRFDHYRVCCSVTKENMIRAFRALVSVNL